MLAAMLSLSITSLSFASDITLKAADVAVKSETGVTVEESIKNWKDGGYVGFKVKMDGIKSISVEASAVIVDWTNGEAFRVRLDNPTDGEFLGYLLVNKNGTDTYTMALEGSYHGERMLYIVQNYQMQGHIDIKSITLSEKEYVRESISPIPDSEIKDNYADTWTATDSLGRRIADHEEVGAVKDGDRTVGIFYWTSHQSDKNALIATKVIEKYPEAAEDYDNSVWATKGNSSLGAVYWDEPLFGFYNGEDYWVFRRHAEMLANAGVDAVFIDCTNGDRCFAVSTGMCFQAFHDAREAGVNTPKISFYFPMGGNSSGETAEEKWRMLKAAYLNFYQSGEYSDLWFYLDGKPMILCKDIDSGLSRAKQADPEEKALAEEIKGFFSVRESGSRKAEDYAEDTWHWLSNYPQPLRGMCDDGRPEFINVGVAINESYETGGKGTEAFSDPYSKGRSYTEAFGDDMTSGAARYGYFMQEQISRALEYDPHFVFVTGWNEWHVSRAAELNGKTNVFIDLYDTEGSRDIEPTKGSLKDNYYNLLVDFIRKYKGVRPAPTASGTKTIDINADAAQWNDVGPEFLADKGGYERDVLSNKDWETGADLHYTAKVNNVILRSKVSYDENNLYFMVETADNIKDGKNFMTLYINADRNYATGWEGYDYAVNIGGKGVVSKLADGEYSLTEIGTVPMSVQGNIMQLSVPRSLIGATGEIELEFKWSDYVDIDGNVLNFYLEGSTAPMGRFNYLYIEREQVSLSAVERERLSDTTVMKENTNEMVVSGGKMKVYEPDTRYGTVKVDGMLYFPAYALSDILGYGKTKVDWEGTEENTLTVKTQSDEPGGETEWFGKTVNTSWMYTTVNSNEAFVCGRMKALSHPARVINGLCYVPASMLEECFGYEVKNNGGVWAMTKYGVGEDDIALAASHIR